MRGGTAHCHLRLSRSRIASPMITKPSAVIAFNQPSVEKFAPAIVPGGLLVVNSSLVTELPDRKDIKIVKVPAYETAAAVDNPKGANMVLIGAYIELSGSVSAESIHTAFVENGINPKMVESNMKAIEAGRQIVRDTNIKASSENPKIKACDRAESVVAGLAPAQIGRPQVSPVHS
jgi:2-oxoglutarate ferredoxin oxidoreductase subunit gamma